MKLLVLGHAFMLAYVQKKYVAMKQRDPGLQLRLVVPTRMQDRFHFRAYEVHSALSPDEVVPLKSRLAGWQAHMTYVHGPGRLASLLRNFQPDVIHIEEEPQALLSVETIFLQRLFAPKASVTLFTWDNILRDRKFPVGIAKSKLRRYSLSRTTAVICGNQRSAELLRSEGYFRGSIENLPQSGLDVAEHEPGKELKLRGELGLENSIVVGHVGRLVPEKGLALLVDALRGLQRYPWKLLLVGAGSLETEIRERWMVEFPGRIVLVPAVSYEEVPRYLRCVDIFTLASYSTPTWKEQFGLSLAQAMLLGLASIGSTSGAIPEVLGPGGILFEEGQRDGLATALEVLLSSATRRQELGALGREFALRNYASESVAARYLDTFERARSRSLVGRHLLSETIAERKA
jgi:glycosyltransferase involved in cell wall biosynthesis